MLEPDVQSIPNASSLSPYQSLLEMESFFPLRRYARGEMEFPGARSELLQSLMGGDPRVDNALTSLLSGKASNVKPAWRKGVLEPSLRQFDRQIAPRMESQFAQHGGSLGSRRGATVSQALGDVYSNATGQLAQMQLAAGESAKQRQLAAAGIPLQQILGQVQGFSTLSQTGMNPILGFLGRQTKMGQDNIATPSPFGQMLGLGGTLGGAALGGGGFAEGGKFT